MPKDVSSPRPRLVPRDDELPLERGLLLRLHQLMLRARLLEERLIALYKQGHGYFWIGGPGEEAFNVPLGLLMRKGEGLDHDYLHAHYRQSATLVALGEDPLNALRQMRNTATDPYSGGRNFGGHFAVKRWNVAPVTSPIEVQYVIAPGTALAQRRHGGDGITIVTGGDAGTAEGDFASCLVWSTRPGQELPLLIVVTNNRWGISTPYQQVQSAKSIADRGKAFGMRTEVVDGNDPVASYRMLDEVMAYIRKERRPVLLEARVSRLYGHSSASGANAVSDEADCLKDFEGRLLRWGLRTREELDREREQVFSELAAAARAVIEEPMPSGDTVFEHVFAPPGPAPANVRYEED